MKIVGFNVNGIRAADKRGVLSFLQSAGDIICLQEIKANKEQSMAVLQPLEADGFEIYLNPAEKAGYSGTAVLTKVKPLSVNFELKGVHLEAEGRIVVLEFNEFFMINCYVPHGGTRLEEKMIFLDELLAALNKLKEQKEVILVSDMNIAHTEKDLSNPKACSKLTGFLDEEREFFSRFLDSGFVDSYRKIHSETQCHTWSSYRSKTGESGSGFKFWNFRFDYALVSEELVDKIIGAEILYDKFYSDHYPIMLEVNI